MRQVTSYCGRLVAGLSEDLDGASATGRAAKPGIGGTNGTSRASISSRLKLPGRSAARRSIWALVERPATWISSVSTYSDSDTPAAACVYTQIGCITPKLGF